jgi:peroxiredoxin
VNRAGRQRAPQAVAGCAPFDAINLLSLREPAMMNATFNPEQPPELQVAGWFNAGAPITLAALKGKVIVLMAFQMLCPGCVEHGIPQAKRIREKFNPSEVAVIGLHSVFEHHKVMTPDALEVFLSEYRVPFPVGVDVPGEGDVPRTMAAYQMQGTPSMLIFDRAGRLRRHYFGKPDDMTLAAEIMAMVIEEAGAPREQSVKIEKALARGLAVQAHDHGHDHNHDHGHHDHAHHDHGDGCGCGHDHGAHDHGHDHGHEAALAAKPAEAKAGKSKG